MISGAHVIVYSKDAEAAFHPSEENNKHELYFMCRDLAAEISAL